MKKILITLSIILVACGAYYFYSIVLPAQEKESFRHDYLAPQIGEYAYCEQDMEVKKEEYVMNKCLKTETPNEEQYKAYAECLTSTINSQGYKDKFDCSKYKIN